jgi:putative endonuclease
MEAGKSILAEITKLELQLGYIIKSLKNGRYYTGCTQDLENRLREHNSGETKSIRYLRPFELVYTETFSTLSEARQRERHIKSQKSSKYIEQLIKNRQA